LLRAAPVDGAAQVRHLVALDPAALGKAVRQNVREYDLRPNVLVQT
jgi:hypothetical protein